MYVMNLCWLPYHVLSIMYTSHDNKNITYLLIYTYILQGSYSVLWTIFEEEGILLQQQSSSMIERMRYEY